MANGLCLAPENGWLVQRSFHNWDSRFSRGELLNFGGRGGNLGGGALYLKKMVCWAVIFWKINGEQAVPTWAESACSEYQVISA